MGQYQSAFTAFGLLFLPRSTNFAYNEEHSSKRHNRFNN